MMKHNPVYLKDSKIGNRSIRTIVSLITYNTLLLVIGFAFIMSEVNHYIETGVFNYSEMLELYGVFASVEIVILLMMTPALTAGTISGERERQTLDMLLATRMRPMQILIGKLYSSLDMIVTLVISNMPILAMVFLYGGIRITELFMLQAVLVLLIVTVGSAGIFFSTLFRKSLIATIVAYVYTGFLTVGTLCMTMLMQVFAGNQGGLVPQILGKFGYILLVNPVMTLYVMINEQIGDTCAAVDVMNRLGGGEIYGANYVTEHWVGLSLAVQVLLALVFLVIAAINLEPIKRKNVFSFFQDAGPL